MNPHTPQRWSLNPDRAALLVIDMQNDFVETGAVTEVPHARKCVPAMQQLTAHCRQRGVPVIYTRHVLYDGFDISPIETYKHPQLRTAGLRQGTRGIEIIDALRPQAGDVVIDKHRYDAFFNTDLEVLLNTLRGPGGIDSLVITGTVTSVCCESTARSAFMRDFRVFFVEDATGGLDAASHQATLASIDAAFGQVVSSAELISALSPG